jgi:hypothetical protein
VSFRHERVERCHEAAVGRGDLTRLGGRTAGFDRGGCAAGLSTRGREVRLGSRECRGGLIELLCRGGPPFVERADTRVRLACELERGFSAGDGSRRGLRGLLGSLE